MNNLASLIDRGERILMQLERMLPPQSAEPDWSAPAFRWHKKSGQGYLKAVWQPHHIALDDLHNIEPQKQEIVRNTRQFQQGKPANNVLLTGARGTGKSSLIKAAWHAHHRDGLKLIEIDKAELTDLAEIVTLVDNRPERFILFCDDLSFEEGEASYKALKSALDGSIATAAANLLVYATSNRRHLLPEYLQDNLTSQRHGDDIHPGEAIEEKIALSERFGLWLSFYPFSQSEYLIAVQGWLSEYGIAQWSPSIERAALQWALGRGSRSGRVAWQFARDWAGRQP